MATSSGQAAARWRATVGNAAAGSMGTGLAGMTLPKDPQNTTISQQQIHASCATRQHPHGMTFLFCRVLQIVSTRHAQLLIDRGV
jgi:hypothetical protein